MPPGFCRFCRRRFFVKNLRCVICALSPHRQKAHIGDDYIRTVRCVDALKEDFSLTEVRVRGVPGLREEEIRILPERNEP